ncbi:hypothetical protein [Desulfosporosinus sp.]|uniref:hypothetical protein n=1 Tax=Desulfosporosinus sp. TaxID=157907 RepID=UPI0025C33B2A|nr:hypothetical protein [Desulfosporosinus sp.]MBC2728339.1 hypothetical protein [Desulfosporosinus sp.]
MNLKKSIPTAVMTLILSLMALYASLLGVLDETLYKDVFLAGSLAEKLIAGSMAQDIISIPASLILAFLSLSFMKHHGEKTFIALLGLAGYFLYGYGLYTIQGQYSTLYLVYLGIFGLSLYSLIFGLLSFEPESVKYYQLPRSLQTAISIFMILILIVLVPLWIIFINADIAKHIPRDTYAVFLLDLCVVFPAFGIIIYQLLRNKPFGNILAGVALFKAGTLCLSVAFGEWFGPHYGGYEANSFNITLFGVLTAVSLVLTILYIRKLRTLQ